MQKIMQKEFETSGLTTLTDFMRWGASQFVAAELTYGHGLSSPLDEAVYLVLRALHLPVDTPDVYWSSALTQSEKQLVVDILKRRIIEKIPAAYIMQEGWFAGLQFYIDERVLVPRSPIAELIENQFSPWVDANEVETIVLAYEPIWAIGTGKTATPEQAQEMCKASREILADMFGKENADKVRILYGGSMNPSNVKELLAQEDIDGGLVGGASLEVDSFVKLITYNKE